jgi:hypothetical protein
MKLIQSEMGFARVGLGNTMMKQISGEVITTRKWELDRAFVTEAVLAHIGKVHGVVLRTDPSDAVSFHEVYDDDGWGTRVWTDKFNLEITGKNKC